MIVLSLFDGMSCGQIAFERAGINVKKYYASEIDKYAIKVSKANFPDIIHLGSVENWNEWDIEKPDIIIAGTPCQGFSRAGKGLNFKDPRSKLFFTFIDILNHYKPKYFLLENVEMIKEWENIITSMVCVEPIKINSALVSAQNRVRLYWTNIGPQHDDLFGLKKCMIPQPIDRGIVLKDVLELSNDNILVPAVKSHGKYTIIKDGKSNCIDANYWKGIDNHGARTCILIGTVAIDNMHYRKLTPVECERLQTVQDNYTSCVSNTQRYKMLGNGWTVDVIAYIFGFIDK